MRLVHRETRTPWHWYTGRLQNYGTCTEMAVIDSESQIVYTEIRRIGVAIAAYVFVPTRHFFSLTVIVYSAIGTVLRHFSTLSHTNKSRGITLLGSVVYVCRAERTEVQVDKRIQAFPELVSRRICRITEHQLHQHHHWGRTSSLLRNQQRSHRSQPVIFVVRAPLNAYCTVSGVYYCTVSRARTDL